MHQALPALQGVALAKAFHLPWLHQLHLCSFDSVSTRVAHLPLAQAHIRLQGGLRRDSNRIIPCRPARCCGYFLCGQTALQSAVSPHACCLMGQRRLVCRIGRCENPHSGLRELFLIHRWSSGNATDMLPCGRSRCLLGAHEGPHQTTGNDASAIPYQYPVSTNMCGG